MEHSERLITLGTMAALIAHEFNNILTPVASYAQMALANPEDTALAGKALERALAGSERAAQIAEVILGFARHDGRSTWNSGPEAAEQPRVNVRDGLDAALASMIRPLERDGVSVDVRVPPLPALGMRPVCLQHVLLNLLLNARAAMSPGGGRLTITARHMSTCDAERWPDDSLDEVGGSINPTPPPRSHNVSMFGSTPAPATTVDEYSLGYVEIIITDSGRGMTLEQVTNLFTPFLTYSDHSSSSSAGEVVERRRGSGLGMTICKRLVEDAGGMIRVRSVLGRGTAVRLVIPAAHAAASTAVAAA